MKKIWRELIVPRAGAPLESGVFESRVDDQDSRNRYLEGHKVRQNNF